MLCLSISISHSWTKQSLDDHPFGGRTPTPTNLPTVADTYLEMPNKILNLPLPIHVPQFRNYFCCAACFRFLTADYVSRVPLPPINSEHTCTSAATPYGGGGP